MREHGTRACYVFGVEPGSDRSKGCRCDPCTDSNRVYARERDRASRRPDVIRAPAFIDATEVRKHLKALRRRGVGLRTVAELAPASRTTLTEIAKGRRKRVTPAVAERVLLVPTVARDGAYIDARPTWRLLNDLIANGYTRQRIARELGSKAKAPALQLGRRQVTARQARAVKALHERLLLPVLVDRENERVRRELYPRAEVA